MLRIHVKYRRGTHRIFSTIFLWTNFSQYLYNCSKNDEISFQKFETLLAYQKAQQSRVISVWKSVFRDLEGAIFGQRDEYDRHERPVEKITLVIAVFGTLFMMLDFTLMYKRSSTFTTPETFPYPIWNVDLARRINLRRKSKRAERRSRHCRDDNNHGGVYKNIESHSTAPLERTGRCLPQRIEFVPSVAEFINEAIKSACRRKNLIVFYDLVRDRILSTTRRILLYRVARIRCALHRTNKRASA